MSEDPSSSHFAPTLTSNPNAFPDKIASGSASKILEDMAPVKEPSDTITSTSTKRHSYPTGASGTSSSSMTIDPQLQSSSSNSGVPSIASGPSYQQPHTLRPQRIPPTPSYVSPVGSTSMSAPPSTISFLQSSIEQKKRTRRDSSVSRSNSSKKAAIKTLDAESGHKRKPSQNTLWQNSRAILGGGIGGSSLNLGGLAPENEMNSPVRHQQYATEHVQDAYRSGDNALISPASSAGTSATPRHYQTHPYPNHPHTIAHTGQMHQYLPHQPSNLGQIVSSQHPLHAFVSPTHQSYQQQHHQHPLRLAHHIPVPTSNDNQFTGSVPEYGAANALASFNFPNSIPSAQNHNATFPTTVQSQPFDANISRSLSALSRTPSDLSFGGHDPTNLNSSQDSSSLDTNLSQPIHSGNVTISSNTGAAAVKGRSKTTSGGPDTDGAAELMLFLAASPSPQQPSKKSISRVNMIGGDSANMKGRRLFTMEDDPSGEKLRSMNVSAPPSIGIGVNLDGKLEQLQHATEQQDNNIHFNHHQGNVFSVGQLQAGPDLYGSDGSNSFTDTYSQQLAQPFEYQDVLNGQVQQRYQYSPYGLVDAGNGVGLENDYATGW